MVKRLASNKNKILFVGTKRAAGKVIKEQAERAGMPYVNHRWLGGMLTNFPTIRKAVKKMMSIDKMSRDGSWDVLSKREKLQISRQRAKLEKILGSISDLTRLPAALFVVDVMKEKIKNEVYQLVNQKYPDGNVVIDSSALVIYGEK